MTNKSQARTATWPTCATAWGRGPEALALLIRCGALDCLGRTRPELFTEVELFRREPQAGTCILPFKPRRTDADGEWQPPDYSAKHGCTTSGKSSASRSACR